jgi:phospholipase A1
MFILRSSIIFIVIALAQIIYMVPAKATAPDTPSCMSALLETGADSLTLGEIRVRCATDSSTQSDRSRDLNSVEARLAAEREAAASPFSILAHKPNYILFAAYNAEGWDSSPYRLAGNDPIYENDDIEMQFQFSFKVPLATNLFGDRMDIYGAYTNRSFWQAYNGDHSEPFRETNHEPELWAQFRNDWRVLGFTNVINSVGWVHQSNGRAEPLSRSWNRLYANFIFERNDLVFSFKPWVWVSKDKDTSDNPDITDYLGHGEIRGAWQHNRHVVSGMIRNQLESGFEEGAVELSWSFPVFDYPYLKGYLQYFYGYGESLIDYNRKVNRIGLGISVTDWLD